MEFNSINPICKILVVGVGGGGCACACACACAGGGRAGCSRKDFNNYLNINHETQE